MEIWVPAPGYEDMYEVSNLGRAKLIRLQRIVTPSPHRRGYCGVSMNKKGEKKQKTLSAHRLVWEAFNGPIPDGIQINHINGDKADNRLENLELCDASQNQLHAINVLGHRPPPLPRFTRDTHPQTKIRTEDAEEILSLRQQGMSQQKIADRFGVSQAIVSRFLIQITRRPTPQ